MENNCTIWNSLERAGASSLPRVQLSSLKGSRNCRIWNAYLPCKNSMARKVLLDICFLFVCFLWSRYLKFSLVAKFRSNKHFILWMTFHWKEKFFRFKDLANLRLFQTSVICHRMKRSYFWKHILNTSVSTCECDCKIWKAILPYSLPLIYLSQLNFIFHPCTSSNLWITGVFKEKTSSD